MGRGGFGFGELWTTSRVNFSRRTEIETGDATTPYCALLARVTSHTPDTACFTYHEPAEQVRHEVRRELKALGVDPSRLLVATVLGPRLWPVFQKPLHFRRDVRGRAAADHAAEGDYARLRAARVAGGRGGRRTESPRPTPLGNQCQFFSRARGDDVTAPRAEACPPCPAARRASSAGDVRVAVGGKIRRGRGEHGW